MLSSTLLLPEACVLYPQYLFKHTKPSFKVDLFSEFVTFGMPDLEHILSHF